jgi:zinc protease
MQPSDIKSLEKYFDINLNWKDANHNTFIDEGEISKFNWQIIKNVAEYFKESKTATQLSQKDVKILFQQLDNLRSQKNINITKRLVLSNGAVALIKRDSSSPLVSISFFVGAGSYQDPDPLLGRAHMVEHMVLLRNSSKADKNVLNQMAQAGTKINAQTGKILTRYLATSFSSHFKTPLQFFSGILQREIKGQKNFDTEKKAVTIELKEGYSNPIVLTYLELLSTAFQRHPAARKWGGEVTGIQKLNIQDVEAYRNKYYVPNNLVITVVGDIQPQEVYDHLNKSLKHFKPKEIEKKPIAPEPAQNTFRYRVLPESKIPSTILMVGYHTPTEQHPDYPAVRLLRKILLSRLSKKLNGIELNYIPWHVSIAMEDNLSILFGFTKASLVDNNLKNILLEIKEVQEESIPESELKMAITQYRLGRYSALESIDRQQEELARSELIDRADLEERISKAVEHLTPLDIQRAAKKYFKISNNSTVVLPEHNGKEQIHVLDVFFDVLYHPSVKGKNADHKNLQCSWIKEIFDETMEEVFSAMNKHLFKSSPYDYNEVEDLNKFIKAKLGFLAWYRSFLSPTLVASILRTLRTLGVVDQRSAQDLESSTQLQLKENEVRKYILKNNITLIVRKTGRVPMISLNLAIPGGISRESDKNNGVTELMLRSMIMGKTSPQNKIAELGGKISYSVGKDLTSLNLNIFSENFNQGLNIFFDILCSPSFKEETLKRAKGLQHSAIKRVIDNPMQDASIQTALGIARNFLFPAHAYRFDNKGKIEILNNLSGADVLAWHKSFLLSSMVVSVSGEITPKDLKALIQRLEGLDLQDYDNPLIVADDVLSQKSFSKTTSSAVSTSVLGFKIPKVESRDRYALEVLARILYQSRLFTEVRQSRGLAYHLDFFANHYKSAGEIFAVVQTKPDKTAEALKIVRKEIRKIKGELGSKHLPANKEIKASKSYLITQHAINMQTNMQHAQAYGHEQILFGGKDDYIRGIKSVTLKDLKRVARKYLILNKSISITLAPENKNLPSNKKSLIN